jgi:mercuric ion transport protein
MLCVPRGAAAQIGRLLCVLLLRIGSVPSDASWPPNRRQCAGLLRTAVRAGPVMTPLHATPSAPASRGGRGVAELADRAGVFGAVLAALCCAGTPFIVSGLAILGLSFLRQDAILWPLMLASLLMAVWGFWQGYLLHGARWPISLGLVGGTSLAAGVIVVHGFPAMQMIYGGALALIVATVWNLRLRRACTM